MATVDNYRTIKAPAEGEYRERGSKFFAFAYPCSSEEELKDYIGNLKKIHPLARHFCYGAIFGTTKEEQRSNDSGEPAGTAGLPILNQILSADMTNVAVIVIRYFGGTKLGKPGLIQAYKLSAQASLEAAKAITITVKDSIHVHFDYDDTGNVIRAIEGFPGASIVDQLFDQRCSIIFSVPLSTVSDALHLFDHLPHVQIGQIA
jgi:uncharacterized YigZ family protein